MEIMDNYSIDNVFHDFLFKDIPNILIISPSSHKSKQRNDENIDGTSFDLITSKFVGRNDNTNLRLLDTFDVVNQKLIENADLFPEKFFDLQGRIMTIALFNYKPYATWEEVVSHLLYFSTLKWK